MENLIMATVSKEESMLLIQHAISAYLHEGKKQKELGELLGIDGSRVSEGKIGKWKLSPSQRQIIIDHYGYPRRGKGQYIKAEVYNSVSEFIEDYDESSKKRFKRRMYELLTRKDYQELILGRMSARDQWGLSSNFESVLQDDDIEIIDSLLSQPETKIWYDSKKACAYEQYGVAKEKCDRYFKSLLNSMGDRLLGHPDSGFQSMLYHIAKFKFELMPEFSFNNNEDVPSVGLKELVITGDEVLNFKVLCKNVSFNNAADILGLRDKLYKFRTCTSDGWVIPEDTEINCKPDNWERVILRLYLSESMHYHLWIRFDDFPHILEKSEADCDAEYYDRYYGGVNDDGLFRNIVIKDLCHINYLKEIEIIRKWCGCSFDFHEDIKREVAKVGGYVPGAEVL
jgi:hypothetical protein